MVVLAADDPACLFGAALPWPPVAGGTAQGADEGTPDVAGAPGATGAADASASGAAADAPAPDAADPANGHVPDAALPATLRPTRRPGKPGRASQRRSRAARHGGAAPTLLSLTSDGEALEAAVRALAAHTARMLVRDGADGARKKIVVETFDGAPVLSTPFADVLQKAGFVRLPDGMRLYVDPFAR